MVAPYIYNDPTHSDLELTTLLDRQYTIIDIDYNSNGLTSPLCFVNFSALKTFGISLDLYFFIFFW